MADFKNKVAIVTGSSRGIGRAVAERLGSGGASVVVNYVKAADKAAEVVRSIEGSGGRGLAVRADAGVPVDVVRLFDEAEQRFGKVDILVLNAATSFHKPLAETTDEEFEGLLRSNAWGPFVALREASKRLADGGRIVSVTTPGTVVGWPGFAAYGASKSVVVGLSLSLAKELGPRGITVNMVMPGATDTDMFAQTAPPGMKEVAAKMSPFGRMGRPGDVADVICFLASDEGRWVTGQHLNATGGSV